MQVKNKLLLSAATLTIIGFTATGATTIFAQGTNNSHQSFVAELAQKLGIDQSKVQSAVDQIKSEHQAKAQTNFENKLSNLVTQGKITSTQKQAILDKIAQLKAYINSDSFKNLTPQEKKQALENQRADLQNWAKQQGIDSSLIHPLLGGNHMGNMMHFKNAL